MDQVDDIDHFDHITTMTTPYTCCQSIRNASFSKQSLYLLICMAITIILNLILSFFTLLRYRRDVVVIFIFLDNLLILVPYGTLLLMHANNQ